MVTRETKQVKHLEWDPDEVKWLTGKGELGINLMFALDDSSGLGFKGQITIPEFHMKLRISEIEQVPTQEPPVWMDDLLLHLAQAAINWRVPKENELFKM